MTDNQPTASGVSEEMVTAAMDEARITGSVSMVPRTRMLRILEAALSAKPAQGGDDVLVTDEMRKIGSQFVWSFDPNYAQTDRDPQGNSEGSGEWTAEATYRAMLAAAPPQPIPTPDEALREILADVCKGSEYEAPLRGNGKLFFWQELALAAMSRVAALSRACPEEAREPLPPVEEIECVHTVGFDPTVPADPVYRVDVMGKCFDFETRQEADNLRAAIIEYAARPEEAIREAALIKHWPFVESPGDFTERLASCATGPGGLLAGVRTVLIEVPPMLNAEYLSRLKSAHSPAPRVEEATMREMFTKELRKRGAAGEAYLDAFQRGEAKGDACMLAALAFGRALMERKP